MRAAVALPVLAAVLAGCSSASDAPAHTSDPQGSPMSTPTGTGTPTARTPAKSTGPVAAGAHAADIPDAAIMRQLARRAEWIARRLPKPKPPADVTPGSARALGYQLMIEFGFHADQWPYLNALWTRESGWNSRAENRGSGAYGIPQALPGSKMGVVGPDWRTNPDTQIRWGLSYIAARYASAQGAWAHSQRYGWY